MNGAGGRPRHEWGETGKKEGRKHRKETAGSTRAIGEVWQSGGGGSGSGGPPLPLTLEEAPRVLLVQRQQLPRRLPDLGQGELHPPDLPLVPQPVLPWGGDRGGSGGFPKLPPDPPVPPQLTDELQLLVEAGFLEGTPRGDVGFAANPAPGDRHGGRLGGGHTHLGGSPLLWGSPSPKQGSWGDKSPPRETPTGV